MIATWASDVAYAPFRAGAALRGKRFFHPMGLLCSGTLTRLALEDDGLPIRSGDVYARLSKGIGTPDGCPDFAGLAWTQQTERDGRWDVLLVSAVGRVVVCPARSWTSATYSTVMPLEYRGQTYWLRARLVAPDDDENLSLERLRHAVLEQACGIEIEQARGTGEFTALALLQLDRPVATDQDVDIAFDPTLHTAPGVRLRPQWLADIRRGAYESSRRGRDAH